MTYDPKDPDNNNGRANAVRMTFTDEWGEVDIDVLFDVVAETFWDSPFHPDDEGRIFVKSTEHRAEVVRAWIGDLMLTRDMLAQMVNVEAIEGNQADAFAVAAE